MRHIHYYIYIMLLLALMPMCVAADDAVAATWQAAPKREMRAVWVTTLNGLDWPRTRATSFASRQAQQRELCQLLDQLKAANINTVLLQARVRGSVIYPSRIEPWDICLTGQYGVDPGYDPLAFAITEAHRRGMELHAWVVTIPCFKTAVARQMGSRSVLRTHPELCVRHGEQYYLDPGLPGTEDYLAEVCREIVSNYDIDGIHFDYIRYPEGATTFADAKTFKRYGNGSSSKALWRRNNITRIVRRIYRETHAAKPWVKVSSSPVGKYADLTRYSSRGWNARDAVHQDAEGWLREGIHDILFPMMYFDGVHFYPFAADWQEQTAGRQVAPGLGIYFLHPQEKNWPLSTVKRQLNYLRQLDMAGQCYFRSKFLTDNVKGLYDFLRDDFYAFPALVPACPWLSEETPQAPEALQTLVVGDATEQLTWEGPDDLRYNVYASRQWPVDVSKAENLVATALADRHYQYNRFEALGLYFAVTAMNRFGNESPATQATDRAAQPAHQRLKLDRNGHVRGLVIRPRTTAQRKTKVKVQTKSKSSSRKKKK